MLGLLALPTSTSARAEPEPIGLELTFHSGIQLAVEVDGARAYEVASGSLARFSVTAHFADGSSLDVTSHPALQHTLVQHGASMPDRGELAFAVVAIPTGFGLVTSYEGEEVFTSFIINP